MFCSFFIGNYRISDFNFQNFLRFRIFYCFQNAALCIYRSFTLGLYLGNLKLHGNHFINYVLGFSLVLGPLFSITNNTNNKGTHHELGIK